MQNRQNLFDDPNDEMISVGEKTLAGKNEANHAARSSEGVVIQDPWSQGDDNDQDAIPTSLGLDSDPHRDPVLDIDPGEYSEEDDVVDAQPISGDAFDPEDAEYSAASKHDFNNEEDGFVSSRPVEEEGYNGTEEDLHHAGMDEEEGEDEELRLGDANDDEDTDGEINAVGDDDEENVEDTLGEDEPKSFLKQYWPLVVGGTGAALLGGAMLLSNSESAAPVPAPSQLQAARPTQTNVGSVNRPSDANKAAEPNALLLAHQTAMAAQNSSSSSLAPQATPAKAIPVIARNPSEVPNGIYARIAEIPGQDPKAAIDAVSGVEPTSTSRLVVMTQDASGQTVWRAALGPFPTLDEAQRVGSESGREFRVLRGNDLARPASAIASPPPSSIIAPRSDLPVVPDQPPSVSTVAAPSLPTVGPAIPPPVAQQSQSSNAIAPASNSTLAGTRPTLAQQAQRTASPDSLASLSRSSPPAAAVAPPPPASQQPLAGPSVSILSAGKRVPAGYYAWFSTLAAAQDSTEAAIAAKLAGGNPQDPPRLAAQVGSNSSREWRLALGPFRTHAEAGAACSGIVDGGGTCLIRDAGSFSTSVRAEPVRPVATREETPAPRRTRPPAVLDNSATAGSNTNRRSDWNLEGTNGEDAYVRSAGDRNFAQTLILRNGSTLPDGSTVRAIRQGGEGGWEIVTDRGIIRSGRGG